MAELADMTTILDTTQKLFHGSAKGASRTQPRLRTRIRRGPSLHRSGAGARARDRRSTGQALAEVTLGIIHRD